MQQQVPAGQPPAVTEPRSPAARAGAVHGVEGPDEDEPLDDGPLDVSPGVLADLAVALREGRHPDAPGGLLPPEPLYLRRPDAVAQPAGPAR